MVDLAPLTALGADAPRETRVGRFALRENSALALASLGVVRGDRAPAPFGMILPGPGCWTGQGAVSAFWIAPGQWMISAEGKSEADFAAELAAEVPGTRITEQTDGWMALDIAAPAAALEDLLERLVNLSPEATGPGRATRTRLDHMGVFVVRRAADHLTLMGLRSMAASLWYAVETRAHRLG